jgi:hypothetical protein
MGLVSFLRPYSTDNLRARSDADWVIANLNDGYCDGAIDALGGLPAQVAVAQLLHMAAEAHNNGVVSSGGSCVTPTAAQYAWAVTAVVAHLEAKPDDVTLRDLATPGAPSPGDLDVRDLAAAIDELWGTLKLSFDEAEAGCFPSDAAGAIAINAPPAD